MITPRPDGGYDLSLAGFTINQIIVDFQFSLRLLKPLRISKDQKHALIVIESPFDAEIDGAPLHCEPGQELDRLGPALRLFMRTVERASTDIDGSLSLVLEGATVRVPADPDYEAWHVYPGDGDLVVAMPGGELAIWDAK